MHGRTAARSRLTWLASAMLLLTACLCIAGLLPARAQASGGGSVHVHYQFYTTDEDYIEDLVVFDVPANDDGTTYQIVADDDGYSLSEASDYRVMRNFGGGTPANEQEVTRQCILDKDAGTLRIDPSLRGDDISLVMQLPWNAAAHELKEGFEPASAQTAGVLAGTAMRALGIALPIEMETQSGNSGIGNMDIGVEYPLTGIVSTYGAGPVENIPHVAGADSNNGNAGHSFGYPENDTDGGTKYCFYVAFEPGNSELFEACGVPGRQGTGAPIYGSGGTEYDNSWTSGYKWVMAHCVQNVSNGGGDPVPLAGSGSWVRIDSIVGTTINCTFRITCNGPDGSDFQDIMGTFTLENPSGGLAIHKASSNSAITEDNDVYSLAGIEYGVYRDSGCSDEVCTITLDSDGNGSVEGLDAGTYWVREKSSGCFYLDDTIYEAVVTGGGLCELNDGIVTDVPGTDTPSLLVEKIDADSGEASPQGDATLARARFSLKYFDNLEAKTSGTPTRSWVFETDDDGAVLLDEEHLVSGGPLYTDDGGSYALPYGTYLVTETAAPDGYNLPASSTHTIVLGEENPVEGSVSFEPYQQEDEVMRGGLMVGKGDAALYENEDGTYYNYAQGDASFKGAEFTIYNKSARAVEVDDAWYDPDEAIMTISTAYDPELDAYVASTGARRLPVGTYHVTETQPPEGYRGEGVLEKTVTIADDGQFTQLVEADGMLNEVVLGGVRIEKRDAELGTSEATGGSGHAAAGAEGYCGTTLAGIAFTITNASDHSVLVGDDWYQPDETVTTIETSWDDEAGAYRAQTSSQLLPYGTYTIQETSTNDSYLLTDGQPRAFEIREHDEIVEADTGGNELVFSDLVARHDLRLQKKGEGGQAKLAHVPFLITNVTTGESHVAVTDGNGVLNTAAGHAAHTAATNANDALAGSDCIATSDVIDGAGIWFGLGEDGTMSEPDDGRGALPYGDYTIVELRCEANAGYGLWSDSFTVSRDATASPYDIDLGTVYDLPGETIGTQASDSYTKTDEGTLSATCTIIDAVRYENAVAGQEYLLEGTLMNRESGEPVTVDGQPVTGSALFTPSASSGTAYVRFEFDSRSLAGASTVAFERLYANGVLVASHEDLADEGQTVSFQPAIGTSAADAADGDRFVNPDGMQAIVDTVRFEGLTPGLEYTVSGTLVDPETGRSFRIGGTTVKAEASFVPEESNGTVEVRFDFDASSLAGRSVVVFERLSLAGKIVAAHEDPDDEGQTVRFPRIGTTATDKADGDHHAQAGKDQVIVDTVAYVGLEPGVEYTLTGTLVDASRGAAIVSGGVPVTAETTFVPDSAEGSIEMEFAFDATGLDGAMTVVFERLSRDGTPIASHEDLADASQSIAFPAIGTKAVDAESRTNAIKKDATVTVIDTIGYSGLIPGVEYTASGTLVDKATGKTLVAGGKPIVTTGTFIPKATSGSTEVAFTFDTTGLAVGTQLVAFEKVLQDGIEVATHADLDDENQTVTVKNPNPPVTPPDTPQNGSPGSKMAKTGDGSFGLLYIVLGIALAGTGAAIYALGRPLRKRAHDE